MERRRANRLFWPGLTLLLACGIAVAGCARSRSEAAGHLALFTTLPILWRESEDIRGLLRSDAPPHWALAVLRRRGKLHPLDSLALPDGKPAMASSGANASLLVMAQPRPLSAQENVALDDWVHGGGRVLLFADPMLTADSAFALGDRRRPQDIVLLSPILTRWGLELTFDEDQPEGEQPVDWNGAKLPVNLPGRFVLAGKGCRLLAGGIGARCRIGKGSVLAIADAALLEERAGDGAGSHAALLEQLLREAAPGD